MYRVYLRGGHGSGRYLFILYSYFKIIKYNTIALKNYERSGKYLDELFDELRKIGGTTGNPESNDLINESYFAALNDFSLYLEQNSAVKHKKNEFIDALYKIFAIVAGYAIANYYLFKSKKGEINKALSAVDRILSTGV